MAKGLVKKLWVILPLIAFGCGTKVSRVQTDSTIDLSGRWNDADSRMVAETMINDCLAQRWLYKYDEAKKRPVVIVGKVVNKSHEHINTETFAKDVEHALLNSARVDFVADKEERNQLRDEKVDQQTNSSAQTAKSQHEETGADLMMIGTVNSIVDQQGREAVIYYQVNMQLTEIESGRTVWIGEKKIKKFVDRATTKF